MQIHAAVQSGEYPNASSLSDNLEVSPKTIQRDLEFMRDRLQLPLAYDNSRFGYYYTEPVDAFPNLQISEGELFALLIAEKALQQYRGTPFEKRLLGTFEKLTRSLPDTVSLHLADWDQSVSFRTTAEPLTDLPIMDSLAQAIQKRKQLHITYRKPGKRQAESRIIDPFHLANVNGDWYLFAHDHLRGDLRTFVPGRIQSMDPTGKLFTRPARFTLEQRLKDSFGVHSKQGDFAVRIHFDESVADYIREKRWHPSQNLVEHRDGSLELRLTLGSLEEIQRWILGWAGHAQVLAPPELIQGVREAAERLLARTSGS